MQAIDGTAPNANRLAKRLNEDDQAARERERAQAREKLSIDIAQQKADLDALKACLAEVQGKRREEEKKNRELRATLDQLGNDNKRHPEVMLQLSVKLKEKDRDLSLVIAERDLEEEKWRVANRGFQDLVEKEKEVRAYQASLVKELEGQCDEIFDYQQKVRLQNFLSNKAAALKKWGERFFEKYRAYLNSINKILEGTNWNFHEAERIPHVVAIVRNETCPSGNECPTPSTADNAFDSLAQIFLGIGREIGDIMPLMISKGKVYRIRVAFLAVALVLGTYVGYKAYDQGGASKPPPTDPKSAPPANQSDQGKTLARN